jgi:hypothetical protein
MVAILLCEGWPSWLFTFRTMQVSCGHVYLTSCRASWLQVIQAEFPSVSFLPLAAFNQDSLSTSVTVFAQGSAQWWKLWLPRISRFTHVLGSLHALGWDTVVPLPRCCHSFALSHLDCGGVLAGQWFFLVKGFNAPHLPVSHVYCRRIRHVVESVCMDMPWSPTPPPPSDGAAFHQPTFVDDAHTILDWNGPLPMRHPFQRVRCQCPFSPTRWALRFLSSLELARAWDVPSFCHPICLPNKTRSLQFLPFLQAAPVKLLLHILSQCAGGGYHQDEFGFS